MGSANGGGGGGGGGYSPLREMRLEINGGEGPFSLCFWLYLSTSSPPPFTPVLHQICAKTKISLPFLVLDEKRKLKLLPLHFLDKDVPVPVGPTPWTEISHASNEIVFPSEKWIHIGCEVASDLLRLHIDGEVVVEKLLNTSRINHKPGSGRVYLAGLDRDDDKLQGYVHNVEVLGNVTSIKDHLAKDPPMQLSVDWSSVSEIEEDSDGVRNVVGGAASCRRNFSLDVTLLDAFCQPIKTENEVVASLFYADNGVLVENTKDAEAPLLTSYYGIDYACGDRPSKLINGRASFKLKLSQLSSNCDNRLFRIRFDIPKMGRYPFLEAFFGPIRSISQNRSTGNSFSTWKKLSSGVYKLGESPSSGLDSGVCELPFNIVHEAKLSPSSKRVKLGHESSLVACTADLSRERAGEACNSHGSISSEDDTISLDGNPENHENNLSDLDSDGARKSGLKGISRNGASVTDLALFKYCLGNLNERALMLKEIATVASGSELHDFAQQVSLYMGCSHHGHQVLVAKRLVEEGTKAWDLISQNKPHVKWENAVSTLKVCFVKIACCISRSLTQQDMELLRRIAGCQELLPRENFERMWCWLFPVAFMLSRRGINAMWNSQSPKWIEGFITKEEAEFSLQGLGGLQEPGTFVLRFPTSRSWPHPDAGNLVVTYVGRDYNIHHRMLSLDFVFSSSERETTPRPLHEMLLAEPELSKLGRIIRSH